jgi:hypothetical protein
MAHYAKVENNLVTDVIVADAAFIAALPNPELWLQTSYNTRGGIHYGPNGQPDGGDALRKNYAGIGYTYDPVLDAFIPPQPYPSWLLSTETCWWEPPVSYPTDGKDYVWNETTMSWVLSN